MKKKLTRILSLAVAALLITSILPLTASAYDASDWEVVGKGKGTISKSTSNGVSLVHEGHYPENNAGILYKNPIDLESGVEMDVVLDLALTTPADAWFCVTLLSKPVYFDTGAKKNSSDTEGYGLVLLVRPNLNGSGKTEFQWCRIDDNSFGLEQSVDGAEYGNVDYTQAGATIKFRAIKEDGRLRMFINNVEASLTYDYSGLVESAFEGGKTAYITFSTSNSEYDQQMFTILGINGQAAVTSGTFDGDSAETQAPVEKPDYDNIEEFVLLDFTKKEICDITSFTNCEGEYDPVEGCLKVTLPETEPFDPYISFPLTRDNWFPGKFGNAKINFKSNVPEGNGCEFFFNTDKNSNTEQNHTVAFYDPSDDYADVIFEVWFDDNMNWSQDATIRSLRWDPATDSSAAGAVLYIKSVTMMVYEEPADETKDPNATEAPEETNAPESETVPTTNAGTAPVTTGDDEKTIGDYWYLIVIGAVVVAAIVVGVVIFIKKKK